MTHGNSYLVITEFEKKMTQIATELYEAEDSVPIIATLRKSSVVRTDSQGNLYYKTMELSLKPAKKNVLRSLCLVSWYLPERLRASLQLAIHDYIGNNINLFDLKNLLKSKGLMLSYITQYYYEKGASNLFGNLTDEKLFTWDRLFSKIKVKLYKSYMEYFEKLVIKKPKPYIGVGYKDKGSKPGDKRGSLYNFMLNSVMLDLEIQRDQFEDFNLMVEGFLT